MSKLINPGLLPTSRRGILPSPPPPGASTAAG